MSTPILPFHLYVSMVCIGTHISLLFSTYLMKHSQKVSGITLEIHIPLLCVKFVQCMRNFCTNSLSTILSSKKWCSTSILKLLFPANQTSLTLQPLWQKWTATSSFGNMCSTFTVSVKIRGWLTHWCKTPASNSVMAVYRRCGVLQ
jgi:hypothetical protein